MARRAYHHGNLRETLIDAAVELISEKSPQGFTLAEAAKMANVSTAAPYRHFKNKDDLIEAVAERGFQRFADISEAVRGQTDSPYQQIQDLCQAYLDFAKSDQGYYMAMFESGISFQANAELSFYAQRALSQLISAAEALLSNLPNETTPPPRMVAEHLWAMSHGIVELFARGDAGRNTSFEARDLLEAGVSIYLRGLLPKK